MTATFALALWLAPSALAAPLAGTPIPNVASGSGVDSISGAARGTASNLVSAEVQPLERQWLSPGAARNAPPGAAADFALRLVNRSNFTAGFALDLSNAAADDFDFSALALALDANGNSVLDAGDAPIAPGGSVSLAPGDSALLVARGIVPASAVSGTRAFLALGSTGLAQGTLASHADTVTVAGAPAPPALAFYTDGGYGTIERIGAPSDPLFVGALASACNTDPARRDSVQITLLSRLTGDVETMTAIETAPSSGVFRIEPSVATAIVIGFSASRPGVLELMANDEIVAQLAGCGAPLTEAHVWIQPMGTVFDSRTGLPLAGASVSLIDVTGAGNGGAPGAPARVYLADGVTPAPSIVTSDALGHYLFPIVRPSTYRVAVAPPAGYRHPSSVPMVQLPVNGLVYDASGSYGAAFDVAGFDAPVRWGVPLDAIPAVALYVSKTASRAFAELGDQVDYDVNVESRSDSALGAVTLTDQLPAGFRYVPGTAHRDTTRLADPNGADGSTLVFALGPFAARSSAVVHYRVTLGPGSLDGDGINRAWASADSVRSNEASARVQITGGVFADEAMIAGTVYVDRNRDGRRGAGEPGMPGVRLYLDDGTFAITDPEGRYTLYGLDPRTHALRLDPTSLPAGVQSLPTDRRDSDRPGTRFVDLQRGDFQRADFAVSGDSVAAAAARDRAGAPGLFASEIGRSAETRVDMTRMPTVPGDSRARPVSGTVNGESRLPLFGDAARQQDAPPSHTPPAAWANAGATSAGAPADPVAPAPGSTSAASGAGAAPAASAAAPASAPLEDLVAALDPAVGFLAPPDGDTLATDQVTVRVKGAIGAPFTLLANGVEVPTSRVALRVASPATGVAAWEYIGVRLAPGVNTLEVAQWGLTNAAVTVVVPDRLSRLELSVPNGVPADGHTLASVRVRARDRSGIPVTSRTLVTLESSLGKWQVEDLDPQTPGVQIAIEHGETAVGLLAPATPGTAVLRASAGRNSAEASLAFVPELRPLFAVGVVEGVVSLSNWTRGSSAPAHPRTGFESAIEEFHSEAQDGSAAAGARGSLFVKGRVASNALLTLGYASDKPDDLRRFRDIQPDAFYPVYGDASVRGYEAQSTGNLYARLDRGNLSVLYGDFMTRSSGASTSLSSYARSLSGAQQLYEDHRVRVGSFTSRERASRKVVELPGQGISGPYDLPGAPILENSERVEIVTYDRDQPGVVVRTQTRARFTDYEIDPLAGRITFKSPVPGFDAELNPVSVRVTYDVESGGDPFWVSGVEGGVKLGSGLEVGGTYVDDHDPTRPSELRGAYLGARLDQATKLIGEFARTNALGGASGDAGRFEIEHESADVRARVFATATDTAFVNPGAGFGPGRIESGGRLELRFSPLDQLRAEGLYSSDVAGDRRRGGGLVAYDRTLHERVRGELGLRIAGETARAGAVEPTSVALRGQLQAQLPSNPDFSANAEYEQSVIDARRMAALGAEYRLPGIGRVYGRHEFLSSLTSPYALSNDQQRLATVFGVDADVARDQHVYGEYRLGNALARREAEAALGLRNVWRLDNGLRVGTSFERVNPLEGSPDGPTTAFTGSVDYAERDDWKGSYRSEVRTNRAADSYLSTAAAACRIDSSWTALGRNLLSMTDERQGRGTAREWIQLGFAYRPQRSSGWDALGRYELHFDREATGDGPNRRRIAHVFSLHGTGRLGESFEGSGSWAYKFARDRAGLVESGLGMQRISARARTDIGRNWDAGAQASTLVGGGVSRWSLGLEGGRQLGGGVWLSAGWNGFGYVDPDFTESEWTKQGPYVRLRARFDERLLFGANGAQP